MNKTLAKIFSFFWDIPIERTSSEQNEYLEVVWSNGKKMLNTKNANFSYGTCHGVFTVATDIISDSISKANDILILGFGCGSILQILREDLKYSKNIVGIEYDDTIISLYQKHFAKEMTSSCEILHTDALSFLKQNDHQYDVIFIDLFSELENSPIQFEESFISHLLKASKNKTTLVFNTTKKSKEDAITITELNLTLSKRFKNVENHNFQDLNNIIIAQ